VREVRGAAPAVRFDVRDGSTAAAFSADADSGKAVRWFPKKLYESIPASGMPPFT
jgi:hypothetical protein